MPAPIVSRIAGILYSSAIAKRFYEMSYNIPFMGMGKIRRNQHAATLSKDHNVITSKYHGKIPVEKKIALEDRDHRHGYGSCSDVYRHPFMYGYNDFRMLNGI